MDINKVLGKKFLIYDNVVEIHKIDGEMVNCLINYVEEDCKIPIQIHKNYIYCSLEELLKCEYRED